jgi:hypothetical protein
MFSDPALHLDLSPMSARNVIVGCTAETFLRRRKGPQWYILGTIDPEHPALPEPVLAIIADDQREHGEELFVCRVELTAWSNVHEGLTGYSVKTRPLIVFDDTGHLVYGQEILVAIVEANTPIEVVQVHGVKWPEEA